MNICGFIFARGGSRGCPGKNSRLLAGKPLIAWAIENALATRHIDRVIVSTDDPKIAQIGRQYGAEVPWLRPAALAADTSPEWLAWRHAVEQFNHSEAPTPLDVFVSIPAVAPLRQPQDIDCCIDLLLSSPQQPDVVFTVTPPHANPYFSMVVLDGQGYASLAAVPPGGSVARRQDAPPVYAITPVAYAIRPRLILEGDCMFSGKIQTVEVPNERAVDIDTEMDFAMAEFLMARRSRMAA